MLKLYAESCSAEELKIYSFRVDFDERGCAITDPAIYTDQSEDGNTTEAGAEIHALALQRQLDHPTLSYRQAVDDIMATRPDLQAAHGTERKTHRPNHRTRVNRPPVGERLNLHSDPAVRVHELALEIQSSQGCKSYPTAVHLALASDAALAAEYAAYTSG